MAIKSEYYLLNGAAWELHYFKTSIDQVDGLQNALDGKSSLGHLHDDRYYVKSEIQNNTIPMRGLVVNANGVPSNNLGSPSVAEMALFQEQFNNKTEFYDISKITFETYDGSIWTDITSTISDANKKAFVGGDGSSGISIPHGTVKYRITLRAVTYVYLNALYMYWSGSGNNTLVHIWKKHDSGSWIQHTSSGTAVSSWPGHMYLPFPTIPWHQSGTLGTHWHEVRVEFTPNWSHASNPIALYKMQWWGGYPAGKRTIYSVDSDKNVSFPGQIKEGSQRVYSPNNKPSFADIQSKPNTLAGYGITDARTATQITDEIAAAIASLVNSSPSTLDTLNELAEALGNDPNFATTMTNELAAKMPKAGGTFTGNVVFQNTAFFNTISSDGGSIAFTTLDYLDFGGAALKDLSDPFAAQDAATKNYVDNKFNNTVLTGNTFVDSLFVDGDPVWHEGNFNPSSKQDVATDLYTTSSRTLSLTDANRFIRMASSLARTVTVPPNSSVAFPLNTEIHIARYGSGTVQILAGSGVSIVSEGSKRYIYAQYQVVTLKKIATDTWLLFGALSSS